MRDVIKEIAEMDPVQEINDGNFCKFCDQYSPCYSDPYHAPDCLWVWCRERLQQRTGEEPV